MSYNLTGLGVANNPYEMFAAVNTASGELFGALTVISIFVVFLSISIMRQNPPKESFFFASLLTTLFSLSFLWLGLVSIVWVVTFSIIMSGAAVAMYLRS